MSIAVLTRRMSGRDPHEQHRAATPLELLFDLCFVVAVSQAAVGLHHALAENHIGDGVLGYLTVFFAIWWAWMNFTWFASSYDTDDVLYRLLTLVQISGVLVLAAGVEDAFDGDFTVITIGYVIMRLAMISQWLRAAAQHPEGRRTAQRYALAIFVVQIGWLARLALPESLGLASFLFLVVAEMLTPVFAERGRDGRQATPWHPEHIAERYGLFVIIVLGEGILSSFNAINGAVGDGRISSDLVFVALSSLITMFALWWSYFDLRSVEMLEEHPNLSFAWGYLHYGLFASIAAFGAGVAVATDSVSHADHFELSDTGTTLSIGIPVAATMLLLAVLHALGAGGVRTSTRLTLASVIAIVVAALLGNVIGVIASLVLIAAAVAAKSAAIVIVNARSAQ